MEIINGGQIAYEAYCEAVGGVSVHGDTLWTWGEMCERRPEVAQAWRIAAGAVYMALLSAEEISNEVLDVGDMALVAQTTGSLGGNFVAELEDDD